MKVKLYPTAEDFLSDTGSLLARDEVRHGLVLGITAYLKGNPLAFGAAAPWFCTVRDEHDIRAAAIRTPPFQLLLVYFSGEPAAIADELLYPVASTFNVLPGVLGEPELAGEFVERWCKKQGVAVESKMVERIYRLDNVNNIVRAPGKLRLATPVDNKLAAAWTRSFHTDVYGTGGRPWADSDIITRITKQDLYIWENTVPVSMAAKIRPTQNGISIGYVYTPPEFRGRGYATSCVASLCREILQSGRKFCTLYADLANPTSNSIYMKIGFKKVCDAVDYTFKVTPQTGTPA